MSGVVNDLKTRLKKEKENKRKDIESLQKKLSKVSEDCKTRMIELQTDYTEVLAKTVTFLLVFLLSSSSFKEDIMKLQRS